MVDPIEEYNLSVLKLWEQNLWESLGGDIQRLCPMFIPYDSCKNPIIVLGINPSHSERDFKKEKQSQKEILEWKIDEDLSSKIEAVKKIQRDAHSEINYFKNIKKFFKQEVEIAEENLFFLDMFPLRHTNQNEVKSFLNKNVEFKNECIKYFSNFLQKIKPRALVVLNSEASKYINDEFKDRLQFKDGLISQAELSFDELKVPIIFSGMITLGLDKYSRERLAIQIKSSFNKI